MGVALGPRRLAAVAPAALSPSLAAAEQASHCHRGRVSIPPAQHSNSSARQAAGAGPRRPPMGKAPGGARAARSLTAAGNALAETSPASAPDRVSGGGDRVRPRRPGVRRRRGRPADACQGTTRVRLRRARPDRAGEAGKDADDCCARCADPWPRISTGACRHGRHARAHVGTQVAESCDGASGDHE